MGGQQVELTEDKEVDCLTNEETIKCLNTCLKTRG